MTGDEPPTTVSAVARRLAIALAVLGGTADRRAAAADPAGGRPVFLVPLADGPSWRDFAYLATVPAAHTARPGVPVVVAVDPHGTISAPLSDFLARYKPDAVYRVGGVTPPPAPELDRGAVGHWPLDGPPPETVVRGRVEWAAVGKVGGAARFDGGHLECGPLSAVGGFSVAAWVKADDPRKGGPVTVVGAGDGVRRGWSLGIAAGGTPVFQAALADPPVMEAAGPPYPLDAGRWYHLLGVREADGRLRLYLDGRLAMTVAATTPAAAGADPVTIGGGAKANPFRGSIDDVRVYGRPFTADEAAALAGNPRPTVPVPVRPVPAASADDAAVALAARWERADRVVVVRSDDYTSALVGSALAARLRVPLLFADPAAGLSVPARDVIARLEPAEVLAVGDVPPTAAAVTKLADARTALTWMIGHGLSVDYFAVVNPLDRATGMVPRASLAAPVLAAARGGAVIPLPFETVWKAPLWADPGTVTHTRPPGALEGRPVFAAGEKGGYGWVRDTQPPKLGPGVVAHPVGGRFPHRMYDPQMVLAAGEPGAVTFDRLLVDLNRDGTFAANEVFRAGDTVPLPEPKGPGGGDGLHVRLHGFRGGPADHTEDATVATWFVGTGRVGDVDCRFAVTSGSGTWFDRVQFDRDGDGRFDGPGEGPSASGDEVDLGGKRWSVSVNMHRGASQSVGDVTLTYPATSTVRAALGAYRAALGRHPEYLCVLGLPDAVPFGVMPSGGVGDVVSDFPYTNTDADPFAEVAVGRLAGDSAAEVTLLAARSVSYPDLIDSSWATRTAAVGDWVATTRETTLRWENAGFDPPAEPKEGFDPAVLANRAVVTHAEHACALGLGFGPDYRLETVLAPGLVESFVGCMSCGLDLPVATRTGRGSAGVPGLWVATRLLGQGAVAYVGNTRPATGFNRTAHQPFWDAVLAGQTVGQAVREGLNTAVTNADREPTLYWPAVRMTQLFGDPAVKLHVPRPPVVQPPRVEVSGDRVTVHAPDRWWAVDVAGRKLKVAPGVYPEYTEQGNFQVAWRTARRVDGVTEVTPVVRPLGWAGRYMVDEHQDGTRTVRWRVRLTDYDPKTGSVRREAEKVEYRVRFAAD